MNQSEKDRLSQEAVERNDVRKTWLINNSI